MEIDEMGKIILLQELVGQMGQLDDLHVWFSIPDSLIMGKPTDSEYYLNNMHGPMEPGSERSIARLDLAEKFKAIQYIFLKNVTVRLGNTENYFNVAMVDAFDISAWGFFQPSLATRGKI